MASAPKGDGGFNKLDVQPIFFGSFECLLYKMVFFLMFLTASTCSGADVLYKMVGLGRPIAIKVPYGVLVHLGMHKGLERDELR